jgi:hypothetical protein
MKIENVVIETKNIKTRRYWDIDPQSRIVEDKKKKKKKRACRDWKKEKESYQE